jgi:hypothetical protein
LFQRYDLEGPDAPDELSYAQLGREFGLSAVQVTNHLAFARRHFRRLVIERLQATTSSEEEFQDEARKLFGAERP